MLEIAVCDDESFYREKIQRLLEKYLAERERGGVRGFFDDVNERMTQFGAELYRNINRQ